MKKIWILRIYVMGIPRKISMGNNFENPFSKGTALIKFKPLPTPSQNTHILIVHFHSQKWLNICRRCTDKFRWLALATFHGQYAEHRPINVGCFILHNFSSNMCCMLRVKWNRIRLQWNRVRLYSHKCPNIEMFPISTITFYTNYWTIIDGDCVCSIGSYIFDCV